MVAWLLGQGKAGQGWAGQGRAGQGRAGQGRAKKPWPDTSPKVLSAVIDQAKAGQSM